MSPVRLFLLPIVLVAGADCSQDSGNTGSASQDGGAGTASGSSSGGQGTGSASGSSGAAGSSSSGSSSSGTSGGTQVGDGGATGEAGAQCANPTPLSNTGAQIGSYYFYDNQWNCPPATTNTCGAETLYVCSNDSWYVTSNEPAGNTAVLTFPAIQSNFAANPLVSSFTSVSSTYAEQSPHVGDYEVAYDIWFNDQANELMIWVDTYEQVPAGSKIASGVSVGGSTFDLWSTAAAGQNAKYMVFYATQTLSSATLDLLAIFDYAIQQGMMPATSTLGQISFGIEICSTSGNPATWQFSDYSVSTH